MLWNRSQRPLGEELAREWHGGSENGTGRPRILFESPDGAEAHAVWSLLERHGCRTMWCTGPRGSAPCALVAAGTCRLVEAADAVVSSLDLRDERCQEVARALERRSADRPAPVVVVVRPGFADQWRAELPSCEVTSDPLSSKSLLGALGTVCPGSMGSDMTSTSP